MVAPSGKTYIFVTRLRQPYVFRGLPPWGIALSILAAGVISYLLALYLTSPVKKLKSVVQSFAEGNLDARVAPQLGSRHDELADLGREFDHMAERIAALISSQNRLLADISHELRSPLARLTVALELARKNTTGKGIAALDRIEMESERVNNWWASCWRLRVWKAAPSAFRRRWWSWKTWCSRSSMTPTMKPSLMHKEVRVLSLSACRVRGSSELLRSGIENVVRNAIRYTAEGTAVEVSLTTRLDTAVVTVRDHGPGVPEVRAGAHL